ncbi:MAG TPA: hypothetical protein DGG95_04985 [Cytophagales bacterium]|jgi:hypothetical protein|nr:hypothetical protein [Cytophagales bacterium]
MIDGKEEGVVEKISGTHLTMFIVLLNTGLARFKRNCYRFVLMYIVVAVEKIDGNLRKQKTDQKEKRGNMYCAQFHGA